MSIQEKLNEPLKKSEFLKFFSRIIKQIAETDKNVLELPKNVAIITEQYKELLEKAEQNHIKNLTLEILIKQKVEEISTQHKNQIKELETKMTELDKLRKDVINRVNNIRDGRDGIDGTNGKDADEERVIKEVMDRMPKFEMPTEVWGKLDLLTEKIEAQQKQIEEFRKPMRPMGRVKVPMIRIHRLTGDVDGSTRSFTLPRDVVRVHALWGTSFPITFDDNDWSLSGNTLTLDSRITTPQSGQTLIALIETLFYA